MRERDIILSKELEIAGNPRNRRRKLKNADLRRILTLRNIDPFVG